MTSESGPPDFEPPDFRPPDFQPPDFQPPWVEPVQLPPAYYPQPSVSPPRQATPPRPARRALVIVLVALATVLIVLVAADRVAPRLIGARVAVTLQKELGSSQRPVVRFGGFPFLTQVVNRRYQRISITARDVPVSGTDGRLTVDEFHGTLTRVRPDPSYRTIAVGHFTGSATIGYPSLTRFVGTPISYDNSGSNGTGFVTMNLGGEISMTGKPTIDAESDQLYLVRTQFRIAGRLLPGAPPSALTDQLFRFPVPEMLGGAQLSGVRAGPKGLVLTGSGDNLTLRR